MSPLKIDINEYLNTQSQLIERKLNELIPETKAPYNQLFCAARYALLGNGKRLRPILTLATTDTLGGPLEAALAPACAIEMIHTYSMIHDDLPCMDNDDFRRGKPSLHRAFPEGTAVLVGDYLLTYAFEVISDAPLISNDQKIQLINVIAKSAGCDGMIGGQLMDIDAEKRQIDFKTLQQIHHQKTGALLAASIAFGAILSNATERECEILHQFGESIGLVFQIIDDVLDVTSSRQKHGKDFSSDAANHKATYVSLLGLESSQKEAQRILNNALDHLKLLSKDTILFEELAKYIFYRNR
jgi:geranylgeranyl diphosphate synthase type II